MNDTKKFIIKWFFILSAMYLGIFLLVVGIDSALGVELSPEERPRREGDTVIMPFTEDGTEKQNYTSFYMKDGFMMYFWEHDPLIEVRMKYYNHTRVSLTILNNPASLTPVNRYPIEICVKGDTQIRTPALTTSPSDCRGDRSIKGYIFVGNEYVIDFVRPPKNFDWFIGGGAGGGGGLECSPGCEVTSLTDYTPATTYTDDIYYHLQFYVVGMLTTPGCSCYLEFFHKPNAGYDYYFSNTTYPSSFTNSVYKGQFEYGVGWFDIKEITSGGGHTSIVKCGGKHGTAYNYARVGGFTASSTTTCIDALKPQPSQVSPADNTQTLNQTVIFTCNATDNTGLKKIKLWGDFNGTFSANKSSSTYGNLVYSQTEVFSAITLEPGSYVWGCEAEDTNSPTNDNFTSTNYTLTILSPATEEEDDFIEILTLLLISITVLGVSAWALEGWSPFGRRKKRRSERK